MLSRFAQSVVVLVVLVLGGCRGDGAAPSGGSERTAAASAALTIGAGSMGSCAGNPARCTTVMLEGGYLYTVALKGDGTAWAWGHNNEGQLGDGTKINRSSPVQVSSLSDVAAIAAGAYHTAALKKDGSVWAWGFNVDGQLGDGTKVGKTAPVAVGGGLSGVVAVAVGSSHTVALKGDGTVWTWGANVWGQLGDGSTTPQSSPKQVPSLGDVVAIAAGEAQTIALKNDGTVWAWGMNMYGQLGDGTTAAQSSPKQVPLLDKVVMVASGIRHTIALKSDGTVWAWGQDNAGQVGDGTTTSMLLSPVQVPSFSGVVAVSGGESHTVALKDNGTVWAWGSNANGQFGNGTTTSSLVPVQTLSGVAAVAAGQYHTTALKEDGSVWSSGYNAVGQLGDGTTDQQVTPVELDGGLKLSASCQRLPTCDEGGGVCVAETLVDGTSCDDGDANTVGDACTAGACEGVDHCLGVTCPATECRGAGVCVDHATGECTYPAKPDGTSCNDADACTSTSNCESGVCVGTNPVTCPEHATCNSGTGDCGCVKGYEGANCDGCAPGYSGFPNCQPEGGPPTCGSTTECGGAPCVDGYCCDTTCDGQCEACDVTGFEGTCSPAVGAPHWGRIACATDGSACGGACDGKKTSGCAYPTEACRAASCDEGTAIEAAACDGLGSCPAAATVPCASGLCDGATCLGGCVSSDDCAPDEDCTANQCTPKPDGGAACGSDAECPAGNECQQGFCDKQGQCKSRSLPERTPCSNGGECFAGACISSPLAPEPSAPGEGGADSLHNGGGGAHGPGSGGAGENGDDAGSAAGCALSGSGAETSGLGILGLGALAALVARRRRGVA